MNSKICVYTCITGEYDNLHEVENPDKTVDYLCFTNNKTIKSKTWKVIYIEDKDLDDHHLSRKIKMLGHPVILKNYDISIWSDASVIWKEKPSDFANKYLKDGVFAAFKHHRRNSIFEEASACALLQKDSKEKILQTLNFLESEHFPDDLGLYEMTVFAKRHNDQKVINAMKIWFEINTKFSKRDQLSFMYAIWKTGLKINSINLDMWNNKYFTHLSHSHFSKTKACSFYFGNSDAQFNFDKLIISPYSIADYTYTTKVKIPCNTTRVEIVFATTPGISIDNYKTNATNAEIVFPTMTKFMDLNLFLASSSTAIMTGDFKKGGSLTFETDIFYLTKSDFIRCTEALLIEYQKIQPLQDNLNILSNDNLRLRQELDKSNSELSQILNSKGWKMLEKIRKIKPRP